MQYINTDVVNSIIYDMGKLISIDIRSILEIPVL